MPDPIERVGQQKSVLEEILHHIPGFAGYFQAEHRRTADKLQRDFLASCLRASRARLERLKDQVTRTGNFSPLTALESLTDRLSRIMTKIEHADRGYSGFFDSLKVTEEGLKLLYEVDLALVADVNLVETAVADLEAKLLQESSPVALEAVGKSVSDLETKFDTRKKLISGVI